MMYKLAAAAGLLLVSVSAQATVTNSFSAGTIGLQSGETLIADFDTTNGGGVFAGPTQTVNGTTYGTGVYSQSVSGIAAAPAGDSTKYLAVLNGGSATFKFDASSNISFDVGSVDDFNQVTVTLTGNGGTKVLNGSDINGNNVANGNQTNSTTNGRVTVFGTAGETFNQIVFSSTGNSFEIDNLARTTAAVPEASTWAMFLMGFGALGVATRRRQRTAVSFG